MSWPPIFKITQTGSKENPNVKDQERCCKEYWVQNEWKYSVWVQWMKSHKEKKNKKE